MTTDDKPALLEIVQDDQTMLAWNGVWSEAETVEGLEKQLVIENKLVIKCFACRSICPHRFGKLKIGGGVII